MGGKFQLAQADDKKRQSCDHKLQEPRTVTQDDHRSIKDVASSRSKHPQKGRKGSERPKVSFDEDQDVPVQTKRGLRVSLIGHDFKAMSARSAQVAPRSEAKYPPGTSSTSTSTSTSEPEPGVYVPLYARKAWKRRVAAQDEQKPEAEVYIPPYARDDWEWVEDDVPEEKQGEDKKGKGKMGKNNAMSKLLRFVSAASHEGPSAERRAKATEGWAPQCESTLAEEVTMNPSDQLKGATLQGIYDILSEGGLNPADYRLF